MDLIKFSIYLYGARDPKMYNHQGPCYNHYLNLDLLKYRSVEVTFFLRASLKEDMGLKHIVEGQLTRTLLDATLWLELAYDAFKKFPMSQIIL